MKVGDIIKINDVGAKGRDGLPHQPAHVKITFIHPEDSYGFSFQAVACDKTVDPLQTNWHYKTEEIIGIISAKPRRPRKGKYIGEPVFQP